MIVLRTDRLTLHEFSPQNDATFILQLVNEPAWLQFIGDRGIRTVADAARYIVNGPQASYARHGFGFYKVAKASDGTSLGMCGLVRRDGLEGMVDIGFAFLSAHRGLGYARESAAAVIEDARARLGLDRLAAICTTDNVRSKALLSHLGFQFERMCQLPGDDTPLELLTLSL